MLIIPIRTESVTRRTPTANYALIAINVLAFLLFDDSLAAKSLLQFRYQYLHLESDQPAFYQFITYQFLHGDLWHLLGNMLFLWVFGNSVNGKMRNGPYLLFYLAGGIFAGAGHAMTHSNPLIGASGAIAAVTTAYLVLFPRSHVTVMLWFFFFIQFFEIPAMLIIGLKIIVWDNIIGPSLVGGAAERVAHQAHLAGYLFGFVGALFMLLIRALPRDQFDMLALWERRRRRLEFARAAEGVGWSPQGAVGRAAPIDPKQREAELRAFDEIAEFRTKIAAELEKSDPAAAAALYLQLLQKNPNQCLSEAHQLEVGREFYRSGRFTEAAAGFDRFLQSYPSSVEAPNVRLLLGIIYARELRHYEDADKQLTLSLRSLRDAVRRDQCFQWLKDVRAALGKPAPEPGGG